MRLLSWFIEQRASARIAFALRTGCMVLNGLLSLVWTPILLRVLGDEKYGTFTAFAAVLSLATAGELGLGGAVAIRTNQLIAQGRLDEMRRLHSTARGLFITLAAVAAAAALILSPWLPGWLGFQQHPGFGPLEWLFAAGAVSVGLSIVSSYVNNSIYAAGTVMWPVLPGFIFGQVAVMSSVVLGWLGQPLWVLQAALVASSLAALGIAWMMYRHSHAVFRESLPWCLDRHLFRDLATTSFWSFLFALTSLIYVSTDRLVINAFFGAGAVPMYQLNFKLCELALAVVITAGAVSLPKVVNLLLNADPEHRARGVGQARRLAQIQGLAGFAACAAYVAGNDLFIRLLFGPQHQAPLAIQAAFVTTLLVSANADIFIQLCGRLETGGLRLAAVVLVISAGMNLALSLLAARWQWMPGVAWATVLAHVGSFLVIAEYVRRRDRFGARVDVLWRSLIAPLLLLFAAIAAKALFPVHFELLTVGSLAAIGIILLAIYARLIGFGWAELRAEMASFADLLGRGRPA